MSPRDRLDMWRFVGLPTEGRAGYGEERRCRKPRSCSSGNEGNRGRSWCRDGRISGGWRTIAAPGRGWRLFAYLEGVEEAGANLARLPMGAGLLSGEEERAVTKRPPRQPSGAPMSAIAGLDDILTAAVNRPFETLRPPYTNSWTWTKYIHYAPGELSAYAHKATGKFGFDIASSHDSNQVNKSRARAAIGGLFRPTEARCARDPSEGGRQGGLLHQLAHARRPTRTPGPGFSFSPSMQRPTSWWARRLTRSMSSSTRVAEEEAPGHRRPDSADRCGLVVAARTISGERRSSSSRTGGMRFGSGAVAAFAPRAGRPTSARMWGRTRPRGWTSRFLQSRCTSHRWTSSSPSGSTDRAGNVPAVRREAERMISPGWALAGLLIVGALESVPLLGRPRCVCRPPARGRIRGTLRERS